MNPETPGSNDEKELFNLLKQKKTAALVYLYNQYAPALYGIILRIVKNKVVAEEVLQEVFVAIWNKIHLYDQGKSTLFSWMLKQARHQARQRILNIESSEKAKTVRLEINELLLPSATYAEHKTQDPELLHLLKNLSPEQQMVVHLVFFEDYTLMEVSQACDIPLGTVKARLRLGLTKLRELFNTP